VLRHDFDYHLPPELIAQAPLAERSASRLLELEPPPASPTTQSRPAEASGKPTDRAGCLRDLSMRDFPGLLRPGDLLVFNDTRVVAARLLGTKLSGGRVEIFLERIVSSEEALVQLRASKPIREGMEITTAGGVVTALQREDDLWRVRFPGAALEFFERWGAVPLPPYIHRPVEASDRERYQSIFARERGAVAAPTASLHFDAGLVAEIAARGVRRTFVTLHVGAGTFQPIRTEDLDSHVMHAEQVTVDAATCEIIKNTRAAGGRIVAVGTTVVRALESAVLATSSRDELPPGGWAGDTRLFIRPGFEFRVVDALLTNFHLPQSTLLMLVCAFAGTDAVLAAYRHAVEARYRFFSYGDAMFLTRKGPRP